jgi:hypothetical protein
MKRPTDDPILPQNPDTEYAKSLNIRLKDLFRTLCLRVNGISDGRLSAIDNAVPSVPMTGTYAQGDFVRNSTPTEAGAGGSKYVVFGWLCTVGGTPGTFVPCRFLTGN